LGEATEVHRRPA